jgi:hypothetical protein
MGISRQLAAGPREYIKTSKVALFFLLAVGKPHLLDAGVGKVTLLIMEFV